MSCSHEKPLITTLSSREAHYLGTIFITCKIVIRLEQIYKDSPSQYIVVILTTISGTNPLGIPYVHEAHQGALPVHLRIHSFQTFELIGGQRLYGLEQLK